MQFLSIFKLQRLHCWSLGMDKKFHPTRYQACDYLSMLGLKLTMLVKGAPVFNDIVLFHLMTHGPKGTKPLITCNDIHFVQIES